MRHMKAARSQPNHLERSKAELQRIMSPNDQAEHANRERWRQAPPEEHGRILVELLAVADTINRSTGRVSGDRYAFFPGFRAVRARREANG